MTDDTRRQVRKIDDPTSAAEIVVLKIISLDDIMVTGNVVTAEYVEGLSYSPAPGAQELTYRTASRTEQVFVPWGIGASGDLVDMLVFCVEFNRKFFALAELLYDP